MKTQILLTILLAISFSGAFGSTKNSCVKTLQKLTKQEFNTNSVEMIWYPQTGLGFGHTELAIDGKIHNGDLTNYREFKSTGKKLKTMIRAAQFKNSKGFYRIKLAVTSNELQSIKKQIKNKKISYEKFTCTSNSCAILKRNTKIKIPFPFDQTPSYNGAFLLAMNKLGSKRVHSVEYVGKNKFNDIFSEDLFRETLVPIGILSVIGILINKIMDLTSVDNTYEK